MSTAGFADDPALAGGTEEAGLAPEGMDPLFEDLEQPRKPGGDSDALERVRVLARSWASLQGTAGHEAQISAHVGRYLLDVIHGDAGDVAERLDHLTNIAEVWLTPGSSLYYPAAGQAVLDAIKGEPAATDPADSGVWADARDRATWENDARRDERERILTAGVGLIAAERERQVSEEGWTTEHDAAHGEGVLARAGACYAWYAAMGYRLSPVTSWPWDEHWWKPGDDPVRTLAKAGALIAAEIDRLAAAAGDPK